MICAFLELTGGKTRTAHEKVAESSATRVSSHAIMLESHAHATRHALAWCRLLAAISRGRGRRARFAHLMPLGRHPAGQRPLGFRQRTHALGPSHLRCSPASPVESATRVLREVSPAGRVQRRRWRGWWVGHMAQLIVRVARLQRRCDCRQRQGAAREMLPALLSARSAGATSGGGSR
jgi:hypothetical protein